MTTWMSLLLLNKRTLIWVIELLPVIPGCDVTVDDDDCDDGDDDDDDEADATFIGDDDDDCCNGDDEDDGHFNGINYVY